MRAGHQQFMKGRQRPRCACWRAGLTIFVFGHRTFSHLGHGCSIGWRLFRGDSWLERPICRRHAPCLGATLLWHRVEVLAFAISTPDHLDFNIVANLRPICFSTTWADGLGTGGGLARSPLPAWLHRPVQIVRAVLSRTIVSRSYGRAVWSPPRCSISSVMRNPRRSL